MNSRPRRRTHQWTWKLLLKWQGLSCQVLAMAMLPAAPTSTHMLGASLKRRSLSLRPLEPRWPSWKGRTLASGGRWKPCPALVGTTPSQGWGLLWLTRRLTHAETGIMQLAAQGLRLMVAA